MESDEIEGLQRLTIATGEVGQALSTGEPVVFEEILGTQPLASSGGTHAESGRLAMIPMRSKGATVGFLFVFASPERSFGDRDLSLLANIGLQIGVAVENARLYQDTRGRLAQLDALQETTRAIVSTLDLQDLLNLIVRQATDLLKGGGGILNLVDWDEEEDEVVACVGSAMGTLGARSSLDVGFSGWVSRHNKPILTNHIRGDPRLNPEVLTDHPEIALKSVVIVPMTVKGKVIGSLAVIDKQGGQGAFNQGDLDTLVLFANQAAAAIENARLYAGEQRRAEEFQAIAEVGRKLTQLQDMEAVLQQVARVIQGAFGYYHVGIGLVEDGEVVYRVGSGILWDDSGFQFKPARLKVGQEGIAGWVAATGQALLVPDVQSDPRYVWMKGSGTRSELTVPITAKGKVIGVLDAQSDQLDAFDDTDLAALESLASQAGTAIENARLYEQAQQLAVVEERQRLARDLHDSVTQALYGMTLYAEAMSRHLAAGRLDLTADQLGELQSTAREALREMRMLIFQLRPLDLQAAGLLTVLRDRLEAVEEKAGLETELRAPDEIQIPVDVEEGLYRIAQEALNNTLKHASARRVSVSLNLETDKVVLEIADDGVGFDPIASLAGHGLGMEGMYERAAEMGGALRIESKPGSGARLRVEVPI
jgi:signal transduction histidine kinase